MAGGMVWRWLWGLGYTGGCWMVGVCLYFPSLSAFPAACRVYLQLSLMQSGQEKGVHHATWPQIKVDPNLFPQPLRIFLFFKLFFILLFFKFLVRKNKLPLIPVSDLRKIFVNRNIQKFCEIHSYWGNQWVILMAHKSMWQFRTPS